MENLESIAKVFAFDNSYSKLPDSLFTLIAPVPVRMPQLAVWNEALASSLGLDGSAKDEVGVFAGNTLPFGSLALAQAYAGHQYGHFTMLGDGRAILLGEHLTPSGQRFDIQLKGSGRNPYSRQGDGRAALGPMLREYLISEAMHALGIPTTRSLAVVTSGEGVHRETIRPGAILTRVAASHLRVGTFEYAAQRSLTTLKALADYAIWRHYPHLSQDEDRYARFLQEVAARQAALVAQWLAVGFIHGVMNTDNMTISGETIDYGPCAFMDHFDPMQVFSSIDRGGRYAYSRQPVIAQWNLARLAEALLPLLHDEEQQAIALADKLLQVFPKEFETQWLWQMRGKLGLSAADTPLANEDGRLISNLLDLMRTHKLDYTNTWRDLAQRAADCGWRQIPAFVSWHDAWQQRLRAEGCSMDDALARMRQANPLFIARNHRVNDALAQAEEHGDLAAFTRLLKVLQTPYQEHRHAEYFSQPPSESERVRATFCGT